MHVSFNYLTIALATIVTFAPITPGKLLAQVTSRGDGNVEKTPRRQKLAPPRRFPESRKKTASQAQGQTVRFERKGPSAPCDHRRAVSSGGESNRSGER